MFLLLSSFEVVPKTSLPAIKHWDEQNGKKMGLKPSDNRHGDTQHLDTEPGDAFRHVHCCKKLVSLSVVLAALKKGCVFFVFLKLQNFKSPQKCWGKIYKEFLKPEFFEHFGRGIRGFRYFSPWVTPRKKITWNLKISQLKRKIIFQTINFQVQFPPLIARCHRSAWCDGSPWCRWASLRCLESDGNRPVDSIWETPETPKNATKIHIVKGRNKILVVIYTLVRTWLGTILYVLCSFMVFKPNPT